MTTNEILYLMGGVILTFASLPQMTQIYITKNVAGINLLTYLMLTAGTSLKMFYAVYTAINGYGMVIILTTLMSLIIIVTVTSMIIYYRFFYHSQ